MGIFERLFGSGAESVPLPEHATVIDVRSPAEFAAGHIEDAVALPLDRLANDIARIAPDPAAPIIVYCQSGARSAAARQQLLAAGYRQVINGGGLHALAARLRRAIVR